MKKLLQFKLYSLLSSKCGMALCVLGCFVTINMFLLSLMSFVQSATKSDGQTPVLFSSIFNASLSQQPAAGVSSPASNCYPEIDIVYTWVNGSDPRQEKALRDIKRILHGELTLPECNSTVTVNCTKRDEELANRFVDNNELRYSLRSVEKNAPWVRHIYIVTNGQIPYWLNLSNPRVSIVTHEEIFVNKSHLPTFSSPAIETHIHRIPGLSKQFLYLNDDTFFGSEVFVDDFYTQSAGQKVYLAWAVPNCNEGCPSSWIGDGYCDIACNVSDCDFDARDCLNYTGTGSNTRGGGNAGNYWSGNTWNRGDNDKTSKYCKPGCPDTWIGDKYCDRACRNLECGYDAGDCEISELYKEMKGFAITPNTTVLEIPQGLPAVYFNLSGVVGEHKITDGSHDNAVLVRTATISQKHKIMTLTFYPNIARQTVVISVSHEVNKESVESVFNITADSRPNGTTTAPAAAANATAANSTSSADVNGTAVGNATASTSSVVAASAAASTSSTTNNSSQATELEAAAPVAAGGGSGAPSANATVEEAVVPALDANAVNNLEPEPEDGGGGGVASQVKPVDIAPTEERPPAQSDDGPRPPAAPPASAPVSTPPSPANSSAAVAASEPTPAASAAAAASEPTPAASAAVAASEPTPSASAVAAAPAAAVEAVTPDVPAPDANTTSSAPPPSFVPFDPPAVESAVVPPAAADPAVVDEYDYSRDDQAASEARIIERYLAAQNADSPAVEPESESDDDTVPEPSDATPPAAAIPVTEERVAADNLSPAAVVDPVVGKPKELQAELDIQAAEPLADNLGIETKLDGGGAAPAAAQSADAVAPKVEIQASEPFNNPASVNDDGGMPPADQDDGSDAVPLAPAAKQPDTAANQTVSADSGKQASAAAASPLAAEPAAKVASESVAVNATAAPKEPASDAASAVPQQAPAPSAAAPKAASGASTPADAVPAKAADGKPNPAADAASQPAADAASAAPKAEQTPAASVPASAARADADASAPVSAASVPVSAASAPVSAASAPVSAASAPVSAASAPASVASAPSSAASVDAVGVPNATAIAPAAPAADSSASAKKPADDVKKFKVARKKVPAAGSSSSSSTSSASSPSSSAAPAPGRQGRKLLSILEHSFDADVSDVMPTVFRPIPALGGKVKHRIEILPDHDTDNTPPPRRVLADDLDEFWLPQVDDDSDTVDGDGDGLAPVKQRAPWKGRAAHQKIRELVREGRLAVPMERNGRKLSDDEQASWVQQSIDKQHFLEEQQRQRALLERRRQEKLAAAKRAEETDGSEIWPWLNSFGMSSRGTGRRLLDMYGDSLKFVNSLMTAEFGAAARKVPAHMPHYIDRDIVEALQTKWAVQFDATSSHQLRNKRDMQYAFAYMYFMMNQRVEFNLTHVWDQYIDTDHNGIVDDNELRTLAVHINGVPVPDDYIPKLKNKVFNCTTPANDTHPAPAAGAANSTATAGATNSTATSATANATAANGAAAANATEPASSTTTSSSTTGTTAAAPEENAGSGWGSRPRYHGRRDVSKGRLTRSLNAIAEPAPSTNASSPDPSATPAAAINGSVGNGTSPAAASVAAVEADSQQASNVDSTSNSTAPRKTKKVRRKKTKALSGSGARPSVAPVAANATDVRAPAAAADASPASPAVNGAEDAAPAAPRSNKGPAATPAANGAEDAAPAVPRSNKVAKDSSSLEIETANRPAAAAEGGSSDGPELNRTVAAAAAATDEDDEYEDVEIEVDDNGVELPSNASAAANSTSAAAKSSAASDRASVPAPPSPPRPPITREMIEACPEIKNNIVKHFSKKKKNRHQVLEADDVAFLMVGTNASQVQKSLDGVREKRHKFICLNDNMNHSDPHSREVVKVLHDFLQSFFPLPSQYELPANMHNRYLHLDELHAALALERAAALNVTLAIAQEPETKLTVLVIGGTILFTAICTIYLIFKIVRNCGSDSRRRQKRFLKILNA
eukprot:TRINITY_DN3229_c0_g1_i1.p2 TRINITY_DN3229_c0_g1~~TRINITY_DN3229_c0_g1_i1.p2  ORF type:complete len:1966 (-),score=685.19 TRINITY_DN3229_c0_g1_i1:6465-12362(-)